MNEICEKCKGKMTRTESGLVCLQCESNDDWELPKPQCGLSDDDTCEACQ